MNVPWYELSALSSSSPTSEAGGAPEVVRFRGGTGRVSRPHTWLGDGHTCLYEGQVFDSLAEGAAYAESAGFDSIAARGVAAEGLPADLIYVGFSLGVLPARKPAQTRPDSSLPSYDEEPATQVNHRVLGFLDRMR
jgi:hypothetical protein